MHEMVNRAVTVGNERARLLSFQEGLCLLLCRTCHELAPRRDVEEELWRILYARYGEPFVRTAYARLTAETRGTLTAQLP